MSNVAAWLPTKGSQLQLGPSDMPKPSSGEIVVRNQAFPLHPGDWKLVQGIIPIPLQYPAIIGNYTAGYVHDIGPNVTRFQKGDRVLSMSAFSLRGHHSYGAYQRFVLASEIHTVHIGSIPFEAATSAISVYAAMSALVLHLGLDRPLPGVTQKDETVLIWGGGSSLGLYAVQIASQAGYRVITTASEHSRTDLESAGASVVYDYHSNSILELLQSAGPYKAVYSANDSAADQLVMGKLLESQGGGTFLSSMGLLPGVVLPVGVSAFFVQYMDDYMKPENEEFTKWLFWEYLEEGLKSGRLQLGRTEVVGGLGQAQQALDRLQNGNVRGKKLVVQPHLD